MPVFLPDCLDIEPDDLITGCSLSDRALLEEVTFDYPIIGEDSISGESHQKAVYLFILSPNQSAALSHLKITDLGKKNIRKLYLVIYAKAGIPFYTLLKQYIGIRTEFNSLVSKMAPTLISGNGKYILEVNLLPVYRNALMYRSAWDEIKGVLRHWLKLVRASRNAKYLVVDVTACLS